MKTETIIAHGANKDIVLTIDCFADTGFDYKTAFAAAIQDYAQTEDGRRNPKIQKGKFTIVDLVEEIPENICQEHGFVIRNAIHIAITIDASQNLFLLCPRILRCQDCIALIETEDAAWFCDEAGMPCHEVYHCHECDDDLIGRP